MSDAAILASAHCDDADCLTRADEPLAGLQRRCGGEIPGTVAIPALLEVVRKARDYGLKLARTIKATDGQDTITTWVEVTPGEPGQGCQIVLRSWQAVPLPPEDLQDAAERRAAIDRAVAELVARLDAQQSVLAVEATAPDLADLAAAMRAGIGKP